MTRTGQLVATRAQRTTLETEAGRVAALQIGDAGAPDVVLLPGFTGSKEDFTPLLDPLAEAGYRVTAIDLPGQFESLGPTEPDAYTPDRLAGAVHSVLAAMNAEIHLVGHSFGGLVARAAVLADSRPVADLVLMSSGPAAIEGLRRQRLLDLEPLLPDGLDAVYDSMQAALETEPGYVAPPAELDAFLRRRFVSGSPVMLAGMGHALRTEPDRVDELAASGVPVLVLCGEHDDAWLPRVQLEMALRLSAPSVVISDAAHSPAVENTSDTAGALIAFWTR